MEVGYNIVKIVDLTTIEIHGALSEKSDSHSRNAEEVAMLPIRKGKSLRKYHPKVMKAR